MLVHAIRILALLAAAGSLAILLPASDYSTGSLFLATMGFAGFVTLPYLLVWFFAGRLKGHRIALVLLLAGLLGAAIFGLFIYVMAYPLNTRPDAQDALVFVVVPCYQLLGVLLTAGLAYLFRGKRRTAG